MIVTKQDRQPWNGQFFDSRPRSLLSFSRLCICLALCPIGQAVAAPSLPADFYYEPYVSGLDKPVDLEWASDGRLFVGGKHGVVSVVENGSLLPTPFIDISAQVNSTTDRGMLGIALHPDFPLLPGFIYCSPMILRKRLV